MKNLNSFKCSSVILFLLLLFSGRSFSQTEIVLVYDPARIDPLTGENPDLRTAALFEEAGYTVNLFRIRALSSATQVELDSLNNADLVYIARAVASSNFQDPNKAAWNAIEAPIMTANMWALRSTRMNWFNSENCEAFDGTPLDQVLDAEILEPGDPVFAGIEGTIGWWIGPYNTIATSDAGNGIVLAKEATANGRPVFVRWEPGDEYYPESVDEPGGMRTFFGLDCDGPVDGDGNQLFLYNKYTDEGKQIFLNEVAWLTGNLSGLKNRELSHSVVYMNHATQQLFVEMDQLSRIEIIDLTGKQIYSSTVNENRVSVVLNFVKSGIYLVKLSDRNHNVVTKKIVK